VRFSFPAAPGTALTDRPVDARSFGVAFTGAADDHMSLNRIPLVV